MFSGENVKGSVAVNAKPFNQSASRGTVRYFFVMPHLFRSSSSSNRYYAWFEAMHTRVDLLLTGQQGEAEFEQIEAAVRDDLSAVEQMGNRFAPDSELSKAVKEAVARPVALSNDLHDLLKRCLAANAETGGLFDITVNSPGFRPGLIKAVELTADGCLRLHEKDIVLDLSGVLKGYALERLRRLLQSLGVSDAVVNLGNSSILSLGNNPTDIPSGQCLTTSGNATAQRRHIRNPLTGAFVIGRREVSVTTPDAVDGEIRSIEAFLS